MNQIKKGLPDKQDSPKKEKSCPVGRTRTCGYTLVPYPRRSYTSSGKGGSSGLAGGRPYRCGTAPDSCTSAITGLSPMCAAHPGACAPLPIYAVGNLQTGKTCQQNVNRRHYTPIWFSCKEQISAHQLIQWKNKSAARPKERGRRFCSKLSKRVGSSPFPLARRVCSA